MKTLKAIFATLAVSTMLVGCNVGNAPEGPSAEQFQKELQSKPAVDQIRFIQASPAPAAEKAAKIEELKKKYNLTDADVAAATAPSSGAPNIPNR